MMEENYQKPKTDRYDFDCSQIPRGNLDELYKDIQRIRDLNARADPFSRWPQDHGVSGV